MKMFYLGVALVVGSCIMGLSALDTAEKQVILAKCLASERLAGYEVRKREHKKRAHSWLNMSINKRIADEKALCNKKSREHFSI